MDNKDRTFGVVFAAFFAIVALLPLWRGGAPRLWAVIVAVVFIAVALVAPAALAPLNRLWLRFGGLLNRITSPIALAILFYGVVMPTGIAMRLLGKDPLRLRRDPRARSYWIAREPPGPPGDSLKNQF